MSSLASQPTAHSTPSSVVALVRCESYDESAVHEAVGRGLALLGGVDRYARPGEQIVLKPNMLAGSPPEHAVTTHPAVFAAVARHLREAGAVLSYGDSPGFGSPLSVARRARLAQAAESLGVPLAEFTRGKTLSFGEGKLIKQFTIADGVLGADGLVSLPKFKTHGLTRITGAIKNQFGCIPGVLKAEFHASLPDVERFAQMLVDLNRLLRPRLYVMDGIVGMEGNGPRGGELRNMSLLLFSEDPVALDATVCRIIDLDPTLVLPIVWGERWGLGRAQAEIVGEALEAFVTPDFAVNRQRGALSRRHWKLARTIKNWIIPRPVILPERCTRCGTCVRVCPVTPKAVDFRSGGGDRREPPVHDYGRCIRCYCCQEMCPEKAIDIRTPLLGRIIHH